MNWLVNFLTSSIGRKIVMSLTGLFLCLYLVIHVAGNLQLFLDDDGKAFNAYAHFMTSNPLITIVAWGTKLAIALHAIVGIMLYFKNRAARSVRYKVSNKKASTWASRNMALLGSIILAFILVHLQNFWWQIHKPNSDPPTMNIDGHEVPDLYQIVASAFEQEWIVGLYVVSMVVLAYHLIHGFNSGFQSLGINHKKYAPLLKFLSIGVFGILIPLLFAAMPIFFYLKAM
jgi:succinate dehydrogenase / fumarate reductase cytochrome b subunit